MEDKKSTPPIMQIILWLAISLTTVNIGYARDSLGEQRTAVILFDMLEDGKEQNPDAFNEALFSAPKSVNQFIQEASYGKAKLSGHVFGWYRDTKFINRCTLTQAEIFDKISQDTDLKAWDRLLVFYHQSQKDCNQPGLGHSSFGKINLKTPQGIIHASLAEFNANYWLVRPKLPHQKLSNITGSVIAHELGHSLGMRGHANLYECGDQTLSRDVKDCQQEAIADMFNIMAGESFYRASLHYSACHKEDVGWLAAPEITTLTIAQIKKSPNPIKLKLFPFEKLTRQGPIAIKIELKTPIPVTNGVAISKLYLEYRTAFGFNSWLDHLATDAPAHYREINLLPNQYPGEKTINTQGIQIRGGFFKQGHCVTTYLFDPKPGTIQYADQHYSLYDHLDAFLTDGETFIEPYNKISITTLVNATNNTLDIIIKPLAQD